MQADPDGYRIVRVGIPLEGQRRQAELPSRAAERVGQTDGQGVGMKQDGLLVAEEAQALVGPARPGAGIEREQDIKAEVSVVSAAVAPIDVEAALRIKAVEHKSMSRHGIRAAGIEDRAAVGELADKHVAPFVGAVFVAVGVMRVAVAQGASHLRDEVAHVSPGA